jgi:hypothetical protein
MFNNIDTFISAASSLAQGSSKANRDRFSGNESLLAGLSLHQQKRFEEALPVLEHAVAQLQEELLCAATNRATALAEIGRKQEALSAIDDMLHIVPDNVNLLYSRGLVLMQMDQWEDGIAHMDSAIALNPGSVEFLDLCLFSRGFASLVLGRLCEGFKDFEHRLKADLGVMSKPEWKGLSEPLHGKTVCVIGEKGLGDNFLFARYVPMLTALEAKVVFAVPESQRLLMECFADDHILVKSSGTFNFDCWVRIMSLAYKFGTDIDSIPPPLRFVIPQVLKDAWTLPMRKDRLKVGLCWSGSRESKYDRHRNIPLSALAPLFDVSDVDFYSLQVDIRDSDQEAFDKYDIYDVGSKVKNFRDTACVMSGLDLVITVDTSVAHLAGYLGVSTWVLLTSFRTYWGFHTEGKTESIWYPSVRKFRQTVDGDWATVVKDVVVNMTQLVKGLPHV